MKWFVILLATAGLFGALYGFGLLQGAVAHPFSWLAVTWAMLLSGVAFLVMALKVKIA